MSEKWWDKALSLVEGCTPVSESCEHCWLAAQYYRFRPENNYLPSDDGPGIPNLTKYDKPEFTGEIILHEDRLDIPLKTRKPTVFAVWSDLFHEKVPFDFIDQVFRKIIVSGLT